MKPSEQWEMFADALTRRAQEFSDFDGAISDALMACAVEASDVARACEKDEGEP